MSSRECVPKLIGGDTELGNFILGSEGTSGKSDYDASRRLLREVEGLPGRSTGSSYYWAGATYSGYHSQDWGRKYLPSNGGCIYIDLNHLELATPEVLSARDYQAVWMAMLRIARDAQVTASQELSPGQRLVVLANNSDRQGNSYGAHQSFLMSRSAWDEMMTTRMIPSLFYLMAYQVSSIVFTGQGKVGSENGEPDVPYQISQRADFIEALIGEQTTFNRPIVNTRDEPLCGPHSRTASPLPGDRYARLHVIFYDANLAPVATFLKVGVMQLILTMIEAGYVDESLILDNPLAALHQWSRDPDLLTAAPLLSGEKLKAVELQLKFLEQARAFDSKHGFSEFVPESDLILDLWEDTLEKLRSRDFDSLGSRLDWVTKRALLDQTLSEHPGLEWNSAEITYLDQTYASIDPTDSLFYSLYDANFFEPVASEAEIANFVTNPPENTRAWTRAMLLRSAGPKRVADVDWDCIKLKRKRGHRRKNHIHLADPLGATKSQVGPIVTAADDFPALLAELPGAGIDTQATATSTVRSIYQ